MLPAHATIKMGSTGAVVPETVDSLEPVGAMFEGLSALCGMPQRALIPPNVHSIGRGHTLSFAALTVISG